MKIQKQEGAKQSTKEAIYPKIFNSYEAHHVPSNITPLSRTARVAPHFEGCTCPDCCDFYGYQWVDHELVYN